jgi:hypothetical protein
MASLASVAGRDKGRWRHKNMQAHFPFLADSNSRAIDTVKEAARLYLDPRNHLLTHGLKALTEADTLTLLLGEHDHILATRLLLDFGSLTALSRATLAELSTRLSSEKAMRLVCAFRLNALWGMMNLIEDHWITRKAFMTCSPLNHPV